MVDAWTQTSNRGSDGEDKNRVHEGRIIIPTKLKNLTRVDESKKLTSTETHIKDQYKLQYDTQQPHFYRPENSPEK
jgi:hypothetical protein